MVQVRSCAVPGLGPPSELFPLDVCILNGQVIVQYLSLFVFLKMGDFVLTYMDEHNVNLQVIAGFKYSKWKPLCRSLN